jgi:PAS domain S-box-containing protein
MLSALYFKHPYDYFRRMKTKAQLLAELTELQHKYDALLYYLPDALLEIDIVNPRLLYMNQMAYALFGYTCEDFSKGIAIEELFCEGEFERAVEIVQSYVSESIRARKPYKRTRHQILYEFTMRKKDGACFLAETQSSFILDKNDIPFAMRTIIRDATQRQRAEHALRISEERFALAISAGKVGIWELDLVTNEIYLSPSLKAILGFEDHEIKNHLDDWMQRVHPDDRELVMAKTQDHIEGKTPIYEVEHRMIHKDGSVRWILARGTATRDAAGKAMRLTGSDTDITDSKLAEEQRLRAQKLEDRAAEIEFINQQLQSEIAVRKHVEQALRESEERYRELYENTPSMYFTVDAAGRVITVNQFGAEQLGYRPQDLLGRSVLDVFHEEDKPAVKVQLERCLHNPNLVFHWQFRKVRRDGAIMWVKEIARGIKKDDGVFVLIVCEDITDAKRIEEERKKLEAQLLQTQKLESLGVLAGGIAHDFNNLLTGVLGNAGMMLMELPLDSPLRDSVKLIELAALDAAQLTTQLLAYAGRGSYSLEVLDLSSVIQEMSQLLKTVVSKNARLSYRLAQPLPAVEGDAAQIRQILINLVANASDAIGDKAGEIVVATGAAEVNRKHLNIYGDLPEGEYVFLEVSDTGCGMDAETQSKIFDPFFSTKFTGRGLGLAAVMGIILSHRGAIRVNSAAGKGATMQVLFPASHKPLTAKKRQPKNEVIHLGNGAALVIDDEEPARNGKEGLQLFENNHNQIRIVLLDLTMPILNGKRTLQQIRRLRPNMPVVLSSGYGLNEAAAKLSSAAFTDFIQKPYQPLALIEKIDKMLGPDRGRSQLE